MTICEPEAYESAGSGSRSGSATYEPCDLQLLADTSKSQIPSLQKEGHFPHPLRAAVKINERMHMKFLHRPCSQ